MKLYRKLCQQPSIEGERYVSNTNNFIKKVIDYQPKYNSKLVDNRSSSISLKFKLLNNIRTHNLQTSTKNTNPNRESGHELPDKTVGYWYILMSSLVFGIVVVGGITRLTESGLSIVEWNLVTGILPPLNQEAWEKEFEKYKQFPEFKKLNASMTVDQFKQIFFWEWFHRLFGRTIGVAFILPALYFYKKNRLMKPYATRSFWLACLIGFQGGLGWYMVKSGLDKKLMEDDYAIPRVSHYRLAAHLGAAFLLYVGFLISGLEILKRNPAQKQVDPKFLTKYRSLAYSTAALIFLTAMSGAFVAGLDAGLINSQFPKMDGDNWFPPKSELWNKFYSDAKSFDIEDNDSKQVKGMWRNLLENPTTVQLNHRLLAMTTTSLILVLFLVTRANRKRLPQLTYKASGAVLGFTSLQVSLGISTLMYMVPLQLAAAHQAGSLALLTSAIYLCHTLKVPKVLPSTNNIEAATEPEYVKK